MLLEIILALYAGIGIYRFYTSFVEGQPLREAVLNGLTWPADVYFEVKEMIRRNYIDKDGPV